jgi:hypothetical protein
MSGNNSLASADTLELLGRLTSDPIPALERIVEKPHIGSGFFIVALTVLGQTLTTPVGWDNGVGGLFKEAAGHFAGQLLKWVGPVFLLHFFSLMSGKKGSLGAFLALTGWSFVVFWPALALRLFAATGTPWSFLINLALNALFNTLFLTIGWWGLQKVYGWSKVQSVFVLLGSAGVLGLVRFFSKG